mmetsp:Transcript_838/g.1892  ORF Transcript_838/g.1892 Transcript_838/m.1892 type:complete len:101 (-) Transcript_838:517-819(-)
MPRNQTVVAYALPFMAFMVFGWYGVAQVVQSKREIGVATRGLESVEELDPLERMRRRYALDRPEQPQISSLEDELRNMQQTVNIKDFDYKPVPRPADEEW